LKRFERYPPGEFVSFFVFGLTLSDYYRMLY
jgi:hypothetical protein